MSYKTVAILKIEDVINGHVDNNDAAGRFIYLVISKSNKFQFWDYTDNAINGSFRRDVLLSKLERQFEVSFEKENAKLENRVDREYIDENAQVRIRLINLHYPIPNLYQSIGIDHVIEYHFWKEHS